MRTLVFLVASYLFCLAHQKTHLASVLQDPAQRPSAQHVAGMLSEAAEVMNKTQRRVQTGGEEGGSGGADAALQLHEMSDEAIEDAIMNDTFLHLDSTEHGTL